jgi:hypothetical protein
MRRFLFFLFFSLGVFGVDIADKVLICGVCRDVEAAFSNTVQSIEALGARFLDYRVIIYENNSKDHTKELFTKWSEKNNKVIFLSEKVSNKTFALELAMGKKNRTEVIAWARNKVLDVAMSKTYEDYKYVIWADLDFPRPWDIENVVDTILYPKEEWDAVFAYGDYDLFAYRDERCPVGFELVGLSYWDHLGEIAKEFDLKNESSWRRVYSAFGGLGIYKRDSIQGCRYSGVVTLDLETCIVGWLAKARKAKAAIPLLEIYDELLSRVNVIDLKKPRLKNRKKNSKEIGIRLCNQFGSGKIVYFSCTPTETLPWTCEHIPFHASMILKGRDKLFVNPKLNSGP